MRFHKPACLLVVALFSVLTFVPHADAQRCVAQGDGVTWGPCGGTGRSITIIIEQQPQIPVTTIVWVRPSAGASSQGDFSHITDPSIRMALKDLSVTGWQQFLKATKAQHAGNLQLAKDYCDAARLRDNSADEQREINLRCDLIGRALFDSRENTSATLEIDKIKRSPDSNRLALEIDFTDKQQELMETLFDPKRVEYEEYRQQILPFYIARAQAEAEAQKFGLMLKEPGKYPVKGADTKALREEAFEEAKKRVHQADAGVKQKLEEIAPLIVIRK